MARRIRLRKSGTRLRLGLVLGLSLAAAAGACGPAPPGDAVWVFRTGQSWLSGPSDVERPLVAASVVYGCGGNPASGESAVHALDLQTGEERWSYLYALDPASGRERWRVAVGVEIVTSPVCAGDLVVFGTVDGRFIAARTRPPTGKLAGETPTRADQ